MNPENQPATKKDLSELAANINAKLDAKFGAAQVDISKLDAKIDDRFGTLDTKIDERFGTLDTKIDERFGTLDTKIDERFGTLDTKIDERTRSLALEIVKTNGRIGEVETRLTKTITQNTDRILTALDRSARIMEADHRAVILHGSILTEVQLKLQDHDLRLNRLEGAPGQSAAGR
jgi:hypothetical protein